MLTVRPYCNNEHYWQVYLDTNRVIRGTLGQAGFRAAEQPIVVRSGNGVVPASATIAAAARSLNPADSWPAGGRAWLNFAQRRLEADLRYALVGLPCTG